MTVNQLILLLDLYRGGDEKRHLGTMRNDLNALIREGLVQRKHYDGTLRGFDLTPKGSRLVKVMQEIGTCLITV